MRIAQIVSYQESVPPKSKNGLEFIVSWLTEELVKRGHEVTLFAPGNSITKAKLISVWPYELSKLEETVWEWDKRDFSDWNASLITSLNHNFDIIHTHTGILTKFLPFINKSVVYTQHKPCDPTFREQYLRKKTFRKYFNFILEQYKKINYVHISKRQNQDYKKYYQKYYLKKSSVIHNGIPIEKFSFNSNPQDYLLYLAYINQDKGADIAIRIARKMRMKLILAGEYYKGDPTFFNKMIRPYLNKDIKYVGPVNFKEKNKLYKNARAFLAPLRWYEPFGLTLIESQACGTPVIAFNKGAAVELIKNNKTGFVVKTEKEMISAIKNINQINRQDCREWVEQNFTVEKMVDEYEKLYQKLVQRKRI